MMTIKQVEKKIEDLNMVIDMQSKLRDKVRSKVGLDVYSYVINRNLQHKTVYKLILMKKRMEVNKNGKLD